MGFSLSNPCLTGPVISSNFPDPSIIHTNNKWYAFGTSSPSNNPGVHIQVAASSELDTLKVLPTHDALPKLADWIYKPSPQVWAPDVVQRKDGMFVMYYTALAQVDNKPSHHCVGAATSKLVEGPYEPVSDKWLVCDLNAGGAIDPSGFRDKDGTMYVLWKVDGNSIGHGGVCGNTVPGPDGKLVPTPIMIQQVKDDGVTLVGDKFEILTNGPSDGPLVEAPSMMRTTVGTYVLFYSAHCWDTDKYNTAYATSRSPTAKFKKTHKNLLQTGADHMIGPGGASIAADGVHLAFHGYTSEKEVGKSRAMYVASLNAGANAKCLT